jgi:endonuclease/exonuclease/phosphatase (EEP) superfamily protein YafD
MTDPVVLARTTGEVVGLTVRGLAALALLPMLVVTAWIWGGFSRPSLVLVLEGFQMYLLAPAWLILVGSLVTRHWILAAVAGIVAVSHLLFCLPAATSDRAPDWASSAPTMSVYVANVRYDNPDKAAVAAEVMRADAEVVILNEMTPDQREALKAAGAWDRYPTRLYTEGRPFGEMLMTRLPADDVRVEFLGGARVPAATITIGEGRVRVFAVHVNAPKSSAQRHIWRRNLDGLGISAEHDDGMPHLYAGDFNSAPWHGPYRDLLARGLTDAHDALGQGLSRSWTPKWPVVSWFGPLMRLDHAVFTPGVAPRKIVDLEVPGSDHRGFTMTMAVEQPPSA